MAIKFLSGLNLSDVTAGSILKLDSNGKIVAATAGTDYATSSVWTEPNSGTLYTNKKVGIGYSDAAAKLHVYEYQTTTPKLLIEDGNTGDASMQFKISTQQYTMGIDNSDSDKFVLAASSALGTTNVLEISTAGAAAFQDDVLVNGSLYTSGGALESKRNSYQLRLHRVDGLDDDWRFYSWASGLNIYPVSASTIFIGRDGATTDLNVYNGDLHVDGGKLGIGTTAPASDLHVNAENASSIVSITRGGTTLPTSTQIGRIKFDADYNDSPINYGYISAGSNNISGVRGSIEFGVKSTSGNVLPGMTLYGTNAGVNVGIGTTSPSEKLEVVGTIQATSAGTATLILRGDSGNSGDTGQLDSTIKMLHDDMNHGILLETRNYAGAQSFEIKSLVAGTETSRFLIDQDGTLKVPAYGAGFLTTDANGDVSVDTTSYVDSSGDTMTGSLTIKRGLGDLTLLTLKQENTGGDLVEQKSFIDFTFVDSNDNETPQVRIGAEVGNNDGSASSQTEEGMGAFVVYTNNADTIAGAAGASLAERFRIDYQGKAFFTNNVDVNAAVTAANLYTESSVINASNALNLRSNVQHGQGDEDAVISFKQSTNELGKFDQDGYLYATGFKTSTASTGFLKADGSIDTSTYASSSHNHNSLYVAIAGGYYDSDFSWDGTHDFQDVIKVSGASATTTNTTALFYGTDGVIEKRSLGTAAFSATGDFAAASHNHSGTYVEYTDVAFTLNGTDITVGDDVTLGSAAFVASSTFATAAQGTTADNALPKAGGTLTGALVINEGASDQTNSSDTTTLPSTTGAEFMRIEGAYTDGRYTTELAKVDRGGNLPLYIRQSKSTANSFVNLARFGDHSNSVHEFEVFGSIKASGGDSGNWNTAYSWGNHASAGYASTTSLTTGLAGKADTSHKYHSFSNGQQYYDGYGQNNYLRLFTENAVFDNFRFRSYSNVQVSADGVNWDEYPLNLDNLFDGREETGINITHETKNFRFEINRSTGWPTTALFVIQSTWTNTSNHTGQVILETWDGSQWIQRDQWTYSNFQRGYNLHTTTQVHNGQNNMRVTILMDWTDISHNYIPLRRILLLSNYSGSTYDMKPFTWNYGRDVTFANNIYTTGGNSTQWDEAYGWGNHNTVGYLRAAATDFILDDGTTAISSLDSVSSASSKYRWNVNTDGRPAVSQANEYGTALNLNYDGTYSTQWAHDIHDNNLWIRTLNTSTDTGVAWKRLLTTSDSISVLGGYTQSEVDDLIDTAIDGLIDSAPGALDTLNELAAALGDDADFSTTVTNSIATKLPLAGGTMTGNINLGDNNKVILGTGSDFEMFHNGSNTFLQTTTSSVGDLYITARGTNHDLYLEAADDIFIRPQGNESGIDVIGNGAVKLYYNGAIRLETTDDGINVPGVAQLGATNFYFHDVTVGDADGLDIKWTLKNPNGNDVTSNESATVYRLRLVTLGTGTNTGAVYICDNVDGNGWRVKKVSSVDSGLPQSNYPFVEIDNQVPKVTIQHGSTYPVRVIIEAFYGGNSGASYEMLGLDSGITNENGSVLMSLGSTTTEATSVMINASGVLQKRELGSLAFNSTTLGTMASASTGDYKTSDATETYVAQELTGYTPTSSFGTNAFTSYTDHSTQGYLTASSTQDKYLRSDTSDVMRFDTSTGEMLKFQNSTSGGRIQIGFQQNDTDGLHHRAYFRAYKSAAGNAAGKFDIVIRSAGGGFTGDIFELEAGAKAKWQGNNLATETFASGEAQAVQDNLDGLAGSLGSAASASTTDFATAAQGTTADNALPKAGGTMTGDIDMAAGKGITFYGNGNGNHGIYGKDASGTASDDIRINSYHNVHINLDSNSNNSTATTFFTIGQHGGEGTVSTPFSVDGNGNLNTSGTLTASGYNDSNWNTAYGWGNHDGLYDAAGDADAVQDNLDSLAGSLGTLAYSSATIPSGSQLVKVYNNVDYVVSGDANERGNYGVGVTVYEGYSGGANRPHTYDTTAQFMSTTGQGFEISADWVSNSTTPLKVRSLRDCCQGWSPWRDVAVAEDGLSGTFYFNDSIHVGDKITHAGDTDTYIKFDTNRIRLVAGNVTKFDSDTIYTGTVQSVTGTGTVSGLSLSDDGDSVDPTLTLSGTISISSANITDVAANADATPSWVPATNPNYLTSYTETDTLASVTGRGASTTTALSIRGLTARSILPEADRTYTLGRDDLRWQIVFCETLDSAGQHESNLQDQEQPISQYATGTVLSWKGGKNRPCTQYADHMRMGIAVEGQDSPLIQGAEPVLVTGVVEEGDYLVTSEKEGHAVAVPRNIVKEQMLFDCVIGKALESGDGDSHLIKTWINI